MSTERLPPPEYLTDAQQTAADRLIAGPRGELTGPFGPLLRSPELLTRLQLVGEYLRFDSLVDDDLVELVILTVARAWDQQFEWGFHHPIALATGLPPDVVDSVGRGRRPQGRTAVGVVWDLVDELQRTGGVSDDVYDAAVAELGEEQVVEVVGTAGYYTTLAMIMNVARTPPPAGAPELPS
ncbi:carboxymuconolactone decarboxylase family protein [Saccharomonospora sp. NPDC046836]|uniref:carboxymuconolactone decarboxylase family protein n=1 Tax=Saccharomonospora sp. NPDC046836 TaxID=3156921 RepID=UPI0033D901E7